VGHLRRSQQLEYIQDVLGGRVNILGGHSIGHSKQVYRYICPIPNCNTVHCIDEKHVMFSHELQSVLMLTVEFSKIYYTR
jgi:hypothetical protein